MSDVTGPGNDTRHWWERNPVLWRLFRRTIFKDVLQGVLLGAGVAILLGFTLSLVVTIQTSSKANGWSSPTRCGEPGGLLVEASCAMVYPAINVPSEATYWTATVDRNRATLDGKKTYVIHFATGGAPPVKAFWSITMGDAKSLLMVANAQHRYSVGSHSGLVTNADGSLDVYLGPSAPAGHEANWLPTPSGNFMLWLRLYLPSDPTWTPPGIQELQS